MSENKKYFLDFGGLQTLWTKMKNTFANKAEVTESINNVNTEISVINSNLESILNSILAISPKEVDNYTAAVAVASQIAPGIAIKVKNDETINGEVKSAGIYLVENLNPISLVFVGNSNSNVSTEELANIISRISTIEQNYIKTVIISDGRVSLGSYNVDDNNNLVIIRDDKVEVNSESINTLTHRAIAAKFKEMAEMISVIPTFKVSVVASLPTENISLSTIYFVKNDKTTTNNLFSEYIYVQDSGGNWIWEKLGEHTINTSDIITNEQLNNAINSALKDYVTTANLESSLLSQKTEILDEISNNYVSKEYAQNNYMSENDIINSIQTGNIGNTIYITDEQINSLS